MKVAILSGGLLVIFLYLIIQGVRCYLAVKASKERLASYKVETAMLDFGKISYMDEGDGEVILSIHGIFGGYDQAYETVKNFKSACRVIAPSRFGYLGSDILGAGTPSEQAAVFVQLLDRLGIEQAYILGTSAGGTSAIRFALDYPERTKGLILYSSAMPFVEEPANYSEYAGPPAFLCKDYTMFLLSPLFSLLMGMDPATIYSMLPTSERKKGIVLDAAVTNPDMARNFNEYPIETLQAPVYIFHAKDDKLVNIQAVKDVIDRFPKATFVSFETGGHLMVGHSEEIEQTLLQFIDRQSD